MRRRNYFYLFVFFILLYLGLELTLPYFAERDIRREIIDNTEAVDQLQVKVNTFPVWDLFFARADNVKLEAREIMVEGMELKEIKSYYRNIFFENGKIRGNNTDLKILITEKALNDYIQVKYNELDNFELQLTMDNVFMKGDINFLGRNLNIKLNGRFTASPEKEIIFIPGDVKIENLTISRDVINKLVKNFRFSFDLNELFFPVSLEEIKIIEGELYLLGGIFVRKAGLQ